MVAVDDLGEADVDPFGEQGVMLDQGARAAHEGVVLLIGEKDNVRIAHRDRAGRMQNRGVDRPDLQFDAARVHFLGQRHLVPVQTRLAHIHRDLMMGRGRRPFGISRPDAAVIARAPCRRRSAQGVDHHLFLVGGLQQQPADAA
ncbi:hypothetical protein D3C80_1125990 [compost metagenome]